MSKFQLEIAFQINGVGAASGIVFHNESLFIISDNSTFLYEYLIHSAQLIKHPIVDNAEENSIKKEKFDFESITLFDGSLYIFGSGSTAKRKWLFQLNSITKQVTASHDLNELYQKLQEFGSVTFSEFNIEGALFDGRKWHLFNRGNGELNQNIIFSLTGDSIIDTSDWQVYPIEINKINGVLASFTDAVQVANKIYFLASAEETLSTYDDGAIAGSSFGCIDIPTMKIDFIETISDSTKFEGISLYENSSAEIVFLLCEDPDFEALQSTIYKLTYKKVAD
jgi:hypothetical protein